MTDTASIPGLHLGPRSVPELLDRALALYLGHSGAMFALSLSGGAVAWLLLVLTGHPVHLAAPVPFLHLFTSAAGNLGYAPAWWALVLSVCVQALVWASLLVLAGRSAADPGTDAPPVFQSVRAGLPRLWPLLVTSVAVGVLSGLASLLLIVPGVFLLTRWTVAPVAAVVERRGASSALGRSFTLVRGLFWHTLGALFLGGLAVAIVSGVLDAGGLLLAGIAGPVGFGLRELWSTAVSAAAAPYPACLLVLLYYDLRARKEGLDLEGGS